MLAPKLTNNTVGGQSTRQSKTMDGRCWFCHGSRDEYKPDREKDSGPETDTASYDTRRQGIVIFSTSFRSGRFPLIFWRCSHFRHGCFYNDRRARARGRGHRKSLPEGGEGLDVTAGQSVRSGFVAVGHGDRVERRPGWKQPTSELVDRM